MAQKLAGAVLARLKGADAAATELQTDRRTIRRWLAAAPDDGWTLARDLAQARLQEQLATGKVNAAQLATVAGIAERNVRYGELLRQREARRQGEQAMEQPQANPIRDAIDTLDDRRQRLMRDALDLEVQTRSLAEARGESRPEPDPEPMTEEDGDSTLLEWIAWLAAMSDEAVEAEDKEVRAKLKALEAERMAIVDRDRQQSAPPLPAPVAPVAPPEPPKSAPRVVSDRDHPSWQRIGGWDL
jgi:hypothetical protein